MSNIVERLRNAADVNYGRGNLQTAQTLRAAADRIEQLEAEWAFALGIAERHLAEIERLRALGDAVVAAYEPWIGETERMLDPILRTALDAWWEARR